MYLVYDETEPKKPFKGSSPDPTKMALKHYSNSLYLWFIHQKSDDPAEKRQARLELDLADRKIKYWMTRGVDMQAYTLGCETEKKKWA